MAKKFKKNQQKPTPPWMTTMGDMNNLLMCFFIVMMGEDVVRTQQEDIQLLLSSFKGNVGIMEGGKSVSKGRLSEMGYNMMALPSAQREKQFARGQERIIEILKPEIQSKLVRVSEDERGLVITLASDAYFDPGSAMLKDEIKPVLKKIANIVSKIPNFVRVEGHTDNRAAGPPGAKAGYETNWELSRSRSINVLRYITEEEKVNPKQMSAVAFGQQRPIDDNNTPEGRAFNRRVDVVILRNKMLEEGKDKRIPRPLPDEEWR